MIESSIPPTFGALAMLIDGRWLSAGSAGKMKLVNPATGMGLADLPMAGDIAADLALGLL